MKIKQFILILIVGILLTSATSMPLVNAQPTHTLLTLAIPFVPTDKECTIEATLKDESGNPLSNMDIDFYICGSENIGTAKTDSNGVASLTYTFPSAETYPIIANFSGTTTYDPSGSEYVNIAFVILDYTPYMVGIGVLAVVIISVVGYIVFRRREREITMLETAKEV